MATNPILDQIIEVVPGSPYSARYKRLPAESKPAGCALPGFDDTPIVLGEVPDIPPSDNCQYDFVPTPISVIPFIPVTESPCPDGFTITQTISKLEQVAGVATATVDGGHNLVVGDVAVISGAIPESYNGQRVVVAVVDSERFSYSVPALTTSPATGKPVMLAVNGAGFCFKVSGTTVNDNAVSFSTTEDSCGLNVGGCINLEIPDIICPNGLSFGGGFVFKVNGELIEGTNTVTLDTNSTKCGADITGEIDIPIITWCGAGVNVHGDIPIRVKNEQGVYVPIKDPDTGEDQVISIISKDCEITLEGGYDLDIPSWICPEGISFTSDFKVKIGNEYLPPEQNTVVLENDGACTGALTGEIILDFPQIACTDGFAFGGKIDVRVKQPGGDYVSLPPEQNTVKLVEHEDGCGADLEGNIDLNIPNISCPNGFSVTSQPPEGVVVSINGSYPPRRQEDGSITREPTSITMTQVDDCNSVMTGTITMDGFPVYRGGYYGGFDYEMYDMVTTVDRTDPENPLTCTWMSTVKNPTTEPGEDTQWRVLGCDGNKGSGGTTAVSKRHPFEVLKIDNDKFRVYSNSILMVDMKAGDTSTGAPGALIWSYPDFVVSGLDVTFDLEDKDIVFLECVVDATNVAMPLLTANICKLNEKWDTTTVPNTTSAWPNTYKFLKPVDSKNDAAKESLHNTTDKDIAFGYVEDLNQQILDINAYLTTRNPNLAGQLPATFNRMYKFYVLIGYVVAVDKGTNVAGTPGFTFTKQSKTYGFVQLVNHHLTVVRTTIDNTPALMTTPGPGCHKEMVPKVKITKTPKAGSTTQSEVTLELDADDDTKKKFQWAKKWYKLNGGVALADGSSRVAGVESGSGLYTDKFTVANSDVISAFATMPPYINSVVTSSTDTP